MSSTKPSPVDTTNSQSAPATLIDGKSIAKQVRDGVAQGVLELRARTGQVPGLATILIGNDPASGVYVANKRRLCVEAGMIDHHRHLPGSSTIDEVTAVIDELAAEPLVSGILLQLPLPKHLDANSLIERIPPQKDVDGLTAISAGLLAQNKPGLRPCTPLGIMELLDRSGIEVAGERVVVVGRSGLVGRPIAQMLTHRDATVTVAHSRSLGLGALTKQAEIVVVAAGIPNLLDASMVAPGAVVIDVGIHRLGDRLAGDVDHDSVAPVASHITPVPGGVGPMTIAMLLRNTLHAAEVQLGQGFVA